MENHRNEVSDDMDDYMQKIEAFKLNTPKRGRPAKEQ